VQSAVAAPGIQAHRGQGHREEGAQEEEETNAGTGRGRLRRGERLPVGRRRLQF